MEHSLRFSEILKTSHIRPLFYELPSKARNEVRRDWPSDAAIKCDSVPARIEKTMRIDDSVGKERGQRSRLTVAPRERERRRPHALRESAESKTLLKPSQSHFCLFFTNSPGSRGNALVSFPKVTTVFRHENSGLRTGPKQRRQRIDDSVGKESGQGRLTISTGQTESARPHPLA